MKYMGSKARIAKHILPIILNGIGHNDYIEPFAGGMNMIDKVDVKGWRFANEINEDISRMFVALLDGWRPKEYYTKEEYEYFKEGLGEPHERGYVGINCSYSGKWFGGFAGKVVTKGGLRNYQEEARRNVLKQLDGLSGVSFMSGDYREVHISEGATVYCDPPYANTTGYKIDFDHAAFWQWVRETSMFANVFVSEYTAPDDMVELWRKDLNSSLSANGKSGGNKVHTEKLFTYL